GLSRVGVHLAHPEARRGVDQAAEAEHRVDDKAPELLSGVVEPALDGQVDDAAEGADVLEDVGDGALDEVRDDLIVALRRRLEPARRPTEGGPRRAGGRNADPSPWPSGEFAPIPRPKFCDHSIRADPRQPPET